MNKEINNNDFNILNRNFNAARNTYKNVTSSNPINPIISTLTGQTITPGEFISRNIRASFGHNVKQNIASGLNQPILSTHTGNSDYRNKRESRPLFTPTINSNYNAGTQNNTEEIRSRIHSSQYKKNELPFDQIHVGKGLGKEATSEPSGGFHPDYREYILPKNIDELRTSSNPKVTYNGITTNKKESNNKRAKMGKYEKRTADTFYIQKPDNYIRTTGAVIKEEQRPAIYIKDNNRKDSVNYTPSANPTNKAGTQRALYRRSTKNNYEEDGPRNLHQNNAWEDTDFGDYGRQTIANEPNERTSTESRNPLTNFSSIAKAVIAPLLDVLRTTKKENFIGNPRQGGNMQIGVPVGAVKNEDDVPRTTIKETVIENSHTGHIKGSVKLTAYDPKDVARTTIKETNIENSHNGNLKGNNKPISFNPNDIARTTIKETNIDNSHLGNLTGPIKLTTYDPNEIVSLTNRQFTSDNAYAGHAENQGRGMGYASNPQQAPNTNRQTTSNNEYGGGAMSYYKKTKVYDADLNSNINLSKEKTLIGRRPTPESVKLTNGSDTVNMNINKLYTDGINNRRPSKGKMYINSYTDNSIQSKDKNRYDTTILDEQINPILLKPFNNNPYTQPLSSI